MKKRITAYQEILSFEDYQAACRALSSILDIYRFSVSLANHKDIFFGHGTDNAFDDCLFLILGSLGLPYDFPENQWGAALTISEKDMLASQLYKRMEQQIPVPYLIQKAYFCGLPFYVDERVLIPRSPIAELIEKRFSPWIEEQRVHMILDLCTGSGCIAAALSVAFPEATVDAVDIDEKALVVARQNIDDLGLQESVFLFQSDGMNQLDDAKYDLIVSNPPYVSSEEMQTLPQEYLHEPKHALEAQDDGLALVHRILKDAALRLNPGGILVVEVGNSYPQLIDRYPDMPFVWLEFERGGHGVFLLTAQDLQAYDKL